MEYSNNITVMIRILGGVVWCAVIVLRYKVKSIDLSTIAVGMSMFVSQSCQCFPPIGRANSAKRWLA